MTTRGKGGRGLTQRRKGSSTPDLAYMVGLFAYNAPLCLERQNYGAGYLFLSLESFASWRLERSGRENY